MTTVKYFEKTFLLLITIAVFNSFGAADPLKCYQCESSDDNDNCIKTLKDEDIKACPDEKDMHCFTNSTDAGKIYRGCVTDPTKNCKDPYCFACDSSSCNKHNICKFCKAPDDPACSQTDANNNKYNRVCKEEKTKCLKIINSNTFGIERRCVTDDNEHCAGNNNKTCELCDGANCNTGIFPTDRKMCFQCSGNTNCINEQKDNGTLCVLYKQNDTCYSHGDSETSITRGCSSDKDAKCGTPDDKNSCQICENDNCNNVSLKRNQTLQCITCNSTVDKNCIYGHDMKHESCKNQILFYQKDSCYKQKTKDNVFRGCLFDRDSGMGECNNQTNCTICDNGNGCNSDAQNQTCIICRSDSDPKCKKDVDKTAGAKCRNDLPSGDIQCFTGTWNNVVIRGCLVDTSAQNQEVCNDSKNKQCTICSGTNCNSQPSGASTKIIATTSMLLVTLLLLIERFM